MDFDFSTETITPDNTTLLTIGGTGAVELPTGNTSNRPVTGLANGALRYNTDINNIEGYVNSTWVTMSTGSPSVTLTGDVTGTGTTSVATTLATVNSNIGTFASVTVNAKGLVTAAAALSGDVTSSGAVTTLATVNSNVGTFASATFNAKGLATAAANLSGDATTSGSVLTLATVNSTPVTASFQKLTTNGKGLVTATTAVVSTDITTALGYTPVSTTGSSLTGTLTFDGVHTVTGLPTPVNASDAAPKSYVDASVAGLEWKNSVAAASTVNLTVTYSNGTSGVGATLTNAGAQAAFAIDGYTAALNDRILIKNQTTQTQNGIYTVTTLGSGATNWVLTRATDANTTAELNNATMYVVNGTAGADSGWTQTTANVTIGTSNIVFVQFSGSGTYSAGTGISLAGNVIANTGVLSVTTSTGLSTNTAATGAVTITNTGVTSNVAGTGISVSGATGAVTVTNTGVTSAVAGTNITVSGATGAVTIGTSTTPSFSTVTSTVATGTAPFTVTSTTNVPNLNASSLNGATFAAPGAIGSTTASTGAFTTLSASSTVSGTGFSSYLASPPAIGSTAANTGAFTTISASGQLTSTVATGSAPFVVASTTNVANLNASSLNGATFAAPGAIGSTTASTGAFTTLTASSTISGSGFTSYFASPPAIGSTTASTGAFTTLGATGAVSFATTTNNQSYTTTGAGTISISSGTAGSINNMVIGATTAAAGTFTSLTDTSLTANSFLYSGTSGLLTTTTAPTNGQLLIGSTGLAPVAATLTQGTGIGIANAAGSITLSNTGVTSAVAGTGISVSGSTGAVTITNTGVTSVALSLPSFITVTGSPVTTTGTLTGTLASQTANTVFIAPNGSAGAPTFRALAYADLPLKLYVENPSTPTAPTATGTNAVALGSGTQATATSSTALGLQSIARVYGEVATSSGYFATIGDAQHGEYNLRIITTTNTSTEAFLDGVSSRLVLPNNSAYMFSADIVARRTDATGTVGAWTVSGLVFRDATASTTAISGAVSKTTIAKTTSTMDVTLSADTTNGSLKVAVTGVASQTIRWSIYIRTQEVTN